MADSSSQSLTMAADPAAIMDVIADFEAYPEWTGSLKKVEVTVPGTAERAQQVAFSIDAGLLKDNYELEYKWSPTACRCPGPGARPAAEGAAGLVRARYPQGRNRGDVHPRRRPPCPMIGVLRRKAERTSWTPL